MTMATSSTMSNTRILTFSCRAAVINVRLHC